MCVHVKCVHRSRVLCGGAARARALERETLENRYCNKLGTQCTVVVNFGTGYIEARCEARGAGLEAEARPEGLRFFIGF